MKSSEKQLIKALKLIWEYVMPYPELEPNEQGWARMQMTVDLALRASEHTDLDRLVEWISEENAMVQKSLLKRYRLGREQAAEQDGKLMAGEGMLRYIADEFGVGEE